ncbi:MAG: OsmC family protein [Dehalococcoidia bacterium]
MPTIYTASATLDDGMCFVGHTGSGFELALDAEPAVGGTGRGPRPMEVVLLALAGCTGMDVISILRKMRQDVVAYEVRVRGLERALEHPQVYTKVTVEHRLRGCGLVEASVARAVELSSTRYCPVSAMLGQTAQVVHTYTLEEAAPLVKSASAER